MEVWIEMTPENLDYVRRCIRATLPHEEDAQPCRRRRKLREPGEGSPPSRRRHVLQNRKREAEEQQALPEGEEKNLAMEHAGFASATSPRASAGR
ncbi:unnamed protein product [Symbiodinium sp. KB8]|nr:unnamed protein product [Symbiodinium sp. KB8]